jgi:2'-5' RNA ligase
MRLFVGIPLSGQVTCELASISQRLRSSGDGFRWTIGESWHITLQFLGNAEQEQYECVLARLRQLHLPPVPIGFEGLGFFDRAGVVFVGVKVSPELLLLQKRVTEATALCGFVPEARAYQPHLTLARSKGQRQGLNALKAKIPRQASFTGFVAEEFLLYESFLGSTGSRYEVRGRFALNGGHQRTSG